MDAYGWWLALGYLCGSIPFGLLIGKARGVDVRRQGSGNVGATNVGRVLGRKWGGLCFVLDVLKGLGPVLAAGGALGYLGRGDLGGAEAWRWLGVGGASVLGHVFPVWLKFKGGKGVATGLGAVLGVWPALTLPGLAAGLTWLLLACTFRYVSLASMVAALALPGYLLVAAAARAQDPAELTPFLIVTGLLAALVVVRHGGNVRRLIAGTESRLGERSGA